MSPIFARRRRDEIVAIRILLLRALRGAFLVDRLVVQECDNRGLTFLLEIREIDETADRRFGQRRPIVGFGVRRAVERGDQASNRASVKRKS